LLGSPSPSGLKPFVDKSAICVVESPTTLFTVTFAILKNSSIFVLLRSTLTLKLKANF
jgi:hypothetical protein